MENKQALYSIEQSGECRFFKAPDGYTADDILRLSKSEMPYLALMKLGEQIYGDEFATIQQSKNFSFSVELNFDTDSAKIYTVNNGFGGVAEDDRDNDNTRIFNVRISDFPREINVGGLINKVDTEYRDFIADMKTQPPEKIIEAAYEITWKNSITRYIENEDLRLSPKQRQALMSSSNSLDEIYEQWCQSGELHSYDDIRIAIDDTANNMLLSLEHSNNDDEDDDEDYDCDR